MMARPACCRQEPAQGGDRPGPIGGGLESPRHSVVHVLAMTTPGACPARSRGAEALFRTLKYSPGFPRQGFATLAAARDWAHAFADGYNTVHRHCGIQYVTPQQQHSGEDVAILRGRHELYEVARCQHPTRWSPSLPRGGPVTRATGVTSEKSG